MIARHFSSLCFLVLLLAAPLAAQVKHVEPGSNDNRFRVTVRNPDPALEIEHIAVQVLSRPDWITSISVQYDSNAPLGPGQARIYTVYFSVAGEAPAGAGGHLHLDVSSRSDVLLDAPEVRVPLRVRQPETVAGVPNVVGLDVREAHGIVTSAGYTAALEVGPDAPSAAQVNTVARQSVGSENEINLVIYSEVSISGRKVPALVGLPFVQAEDLLAGRDLFADIEIDQKPEYPEQAATVYRQYPEPGLEVPRGTGIRLWVYAEPPETKTTKLECLTEKCAKDPSILCSSLLGRWVGHKPNIGVELNRGGLARVHTGQDVLNAEWTCTESPDETKVEATIDKEPTNPAYAVYIDGKLKLCKTKEGGECLTRGSIAPPQVVNVCKAEAQFRPKSSTAMVKVCNPNASIVYSGCATLHCVTDMELAEHLRKHPEYTKNELIRQCNTKRCNKTWSSTGLANDGACAFCPAPLSYSKKHRCCV